jgi:hypothetical protein
MPPPDATGLWSVQARAITNVEESLRDGRAPALDPDGYRIGRDLHGDEA